MFGTDWSDEARAHRVVVREAAPEAVAAPDYVDAFAVARPRGDARSAESLARAALEGAPRPARAVVVAAWRVLGFRLGPRRSQAHVLGWRVARSDSDSVELAADGDRSSSRIVVREIEGEVITTTFLVLRSPVARLCWVVLSPVHRRMARYLIDRIRTA